MVGPRWRGWALGVTVAAGCAAAKPPTTSPPAEAAPVQPRRVDPELLAVADEIDPGPQAPLFEALPAWLRARVGAAPDRKIAAEQVREALLAWEKAQPQSNDQLMFALLGLGRGLVLAEQAVADGSDDPELLLALAKVYAILDNPVFGSEQGMFQQILQFAGQMLQADQTAGADGAELVAGLRTVLARAGVLHRRTAAELLRRHGDHPEIARVLARLSDDESRRERFDRAMHLRALALRRLGPRATGVDQIDAAWTCYKSLDQVRGDAALQQARRLGSDRPGDAKAVAAFATRLARLEEAAAQVKKIRELAADPRVQDPKHPEIEPALERAHLLVVLGRSHDAEAAYTALRTAHPEDARPLAGLAKVAINRGGDFAAAARHIDAARGLGRRDGDFFEVALGAAGMKFLTSVLPAVAQGKPDEAGKMVGPLLDELHEYAEGYKKFTPARADVVLALEAGGRELISAMASKTDDAWGRVLRGLQTRTAALVARHPDSLDVRRLSYFTAGFSREEQAALAAVRLPLSPALMSDVGIQRMRVQTWLDVAVLWEAPGELPALEAAALALPVEEGDRVRPTALATLAALKFRGQGDRAAGEQAAAMFDELAKEGPSELRVAALNNAGSLRGALGDPQGAVERFMAALALDPRAHAAMLNVAATVLSVEGAQRPDLAEVFAVVARDATTTALKLQAHAWRHVQAQRGAGDVEAVRRDLAELVAEVHADDLRPPGPAHRRWGAYATGNVQLHMSYSVGPGLTIVNQLSATEWLVEPAPGYDALISEAERAAKKLPKKKKPAAK